MSERIICNDNGGELREEIVRCRDCEHCNEEHYGAWGRVWHCERFGDVEPDGYCKWGERRAADDD